MPIPLNGTLHYQARFSLRGRPADEVWRDCAREVRSWISRRVDDDSGLGRGWFFSGGRWPMPNRVLVTTDRHPKSAGEEAPEIWGVRFEHPCSEFNFRQWATDIGVTLRPEDGVDVDVIVRHWIQPSYIGEEPPAPTPSAPALERDLETLQGTP